MRRNVAVRLVTFFTLSRVPLALVFAWTYTRGAKESIGWALTAGALLALAVLSDHLDGRLARAYDVVTPAGKVLDPLADMFLFLVVFTVFWHIGWCWLPVLVVFYVREASMHLLVRPALRRRGKSVGARWSGKAKTVTQGLVSAFMVATPLLERAFGAPVPVLVWKLALTGCAALSLGSLGPYLAALREAGAPESAAE